MNMSTPFLSGRLETFARRVLCDDAVVHPRAALRAELHLRGVCHAILWHDDAEERQAFAEYVKVFGNAVTPVTGELNLARDHWGRSIAACNGIYRAADGSARLSKVAFTRTIPGKKKEDRSSMSDVELFYGLGSSAKALIEGIASGSIVVRMACVHADGRGPGGGPGTRQKYRPTTLRGWSFQVRPAHLRATPSGEYTRLVVVTPAAEWSPLATWGNILEMFPR